MAKTKNVTAEQVAAFMDKLEDLKSESYEIVEAINKCKVDEIRKVQPRARSIIAFARDLNDLAIRLFTLDDLQKQSQHINDAKEILGGKLSSNENTADLSKKS